MAGNGVLEKQFNEQVESMVMNGFACLSLTLGYELGLFEHLSTEPKTAQQIADKAGYKERYVREWLNAMTVAKIVEADQDGKTFWIQGYKMKTLAKGSPLMLYSTALPMFAMVYDQIYNCFNKDGPLGTPYSAYTKFYKFITDVSDKSQYASLLSEFVPTVPGLKEKFENGITYLDLGCGRGTPSYLLAKAYPKSDLHGLDFVQSAVDFANERAAETGLKNLHYHQQDAAKMSKDWSNKFDYLTAFDAIHDQAYPDKVLAEIFRVLKPGGIFSMADINAHTNVCMNKKMNASPFLYTCSLFHCMAVSLNFEGGMGLGTMWGKEKAAEMLTAAGFVKVVFHDVPNSSFFNYHCICYKPTN